MTVYYSNLKQSKEKSGRVKKKNKGRSGPHLGLVK